MGATEQLTDGSTSQAASKGDRLCRRSCQQRRWEDPEREVSATGGGGALLKGCCVSGLSLLGARQEQLTSSVRKQGIDLGEASVASQRQVDLATNRSLALSMAATGGT